MKNDLQTLIQLIENVMELIEISVEEKQEMMDFEIIQSKEYIALQKFLHEYYLTDITMPHVELPNIILPNYKEPYIDLNG